ncbi:hypothetical protein [Burkholderia plantarii]|uniref:hypothetical protein n=1 Tax=Burkholderia plantarii TaxID=41899 RepID=UPI00087081F4|nr:hypothetical protein [Burkholderia plantarii]WLE62127.1 hypothetical protein GIY62_32545 [Burkholderia plantarii]
MKIKIPGLAVATALLAVGVLSGCTIQLAPSYDQSVVDRLNKTNASALTLFTSLEQGVKPQEYQKYDAQFSQVIGSYKSLRDQVTTRPVPALGKAFVEKAKLIKSPDGKSLLDDICSDAGDCVYPTPKIIDSIVDTLEAVRRFAGNSGFAPATGSCTGSERTGVRRYECIYQHEAMQALYVESALKR